MKTDAVNRKRVRRALLPVAGLALLALVPSAAFAHASVTLGVNLGGYYAPPPRIYYAPAPRVYYEPRRVYYYSPYPAHYEHYEHHREWREHERREWRHHEREHR